MERASGDTSGLDTLQFLVTNVTRWYVDCKVPALIPSVLGVPMDTVLTRAHSVPVPQQYHDTKLPQYSWYHVA